ncbi:MAG TPA: hypothetical protein VF516_46565 [Kofleriaceae bacterium]
MTTQLNLTVPLDGTPDKPLDTSAYAFDGSGALLQSAPLDAGKAKLTVPDTAVARMRVFVGPTLPKDRASKPTADILEKLGGYELVISKRVPGSLDLSLQPISSDYWKRWFLCRCRVVGRIVKPVSIGGVMTDLPVCHAKVKIFEVDPFWFWLKRLPDPDLFKLRSQLAAELAPPHLPVPGPDPRVTAAAEGLPTLTRAQFPLEQKLALGSDSAIVVRKALLANPALLRPLFCRSIWSWLTPWLRTTLITTVETDNQGRFESYIWHPCVDQPDLYFNVDYMIDGTLTTVYHRPVACDTHWDYACGSDVVIRVTDPRVLPCAPVSTPGLSIDVKRVGSTGYLHRLRSTGAPQGLIAWNGTLDPRAQETGQTPVPFGGNLYLYSDFSQGLRAGTVATHYLWSYRRIPVGGTPGGWKPILTPVVRNYVVHPTAGPDRTGVYSLAETVSSGTYFHIQPNDVPSTLYNAGETAEWTVLNEKIDLATASLDTTTAETGGTALGLFDDSSGPVQGLYEFKLELFKKNSSGGMDLVNVDTAGITINVWRLTGHPADPVDFVIAGNDFRFTADTTPIKTAFRMPIRLDNNLLEATITPASVPSASAGPCGFIDYHPGVHVTLGFHAFQRNTWGTYSFAVSRGSAGTLGWPVSINSARVGTVPPPSPSPSPYTSSGSGTFSGPFTINTLMAQIGSGPPNACTDGRAAFAENLSVVAMITNGEDWTQRISAQPLAFALNPI